MTGTATDAQTLSEQELNAHIKNCGAQVQALYAQFEQSGFSDMHLRDQARDMAGAMASAVLVRSARFGAQRHAAFERSLLSRRGS